MQQKLSKVGEGFLNKQLQSECEVILMLYSLIHLHQWPFVYCTHHESTVHFPEPSSGILTSAAELSPGCVTTESSTAFFKAAVDCWVDQV